jgi:hypothetical protein
VVGAIRQSSIDSKGTPMQRHHHRIWAAAAAVAFGLALLLPAGQLAAVGASGAQHAPSAHQSDTFTMDEILEAGHGFFGTMTKGVADAVEFVFSKAGRPSGYIVGQEASGAFIGGLRYGEGVLHLKNGTSRKIYWQGPSVGLDWGGNGSRSLVLVYDIDSVDEIFDRFIGVEGSAYVVGGIGVNFQKNQKLKLAPIRTGVGARFGANMGYLKYTGQPTWNPF